MVTWFCPSGNLWPTTSRMFTVVMKGLMTRASMKNSPTENGSNQVKKIFISLINSYMFFIGGIILDCEHVTSIKKRYMLLEPHVLTVSSSIRSNYRLLPTSMYSTCKYMYNKQMYVL